MSYGKSSEWKIEFDEGFAEDIKRLDRQTQHRIKKYLDKLQVECTDPRQRGEPLKANLAGFWRYRVGNYRLICKIIDSHVVLLCLLAATHRKSSYSNKQINQLINRALDLKI